MLNQYAVNAIHYLILIDVVSGVFPISLFSISNFFIFLSVRRMSLAETVSSKWSANPLVLPMPVLAAPSRRLWPMSPPSVPCHFEWSGNGRPRRDIWRRVSVVASKQPAMAAGHFWRISWPSFRSWQKQRMTQVLAWLWDVGGFQSVSTSLTSLSNSSKAYKSYKELVERFPRAILCRGT